MSATSNPLSFFWLVKARQLFRNDPRICTIPLPKPRVAKEKGGGRWDHDALDGSLAFCSLGS
jgi:hypothetical protein